MSEAKSDTLFTGLINYILGLKKKHIKQICFIYGSPRTTTLFIVLTLKIFDILRGEKELNYYMIS